MIEITRIDDNGFKLIQDGVESNQPAKYIVTANNDTVTLTSSAEFFRRQIIGKYDEYTINGVVPSSADEAVQLLRAFVFLKSEGGGGSGTGQPTSHSQLTGLDYASSGHTGFASTSYVDTSINNAINQASGDFLSTSGGIVSGFIQADKFVKYGGSATSILMSDGNVQPLYPFTWNVTIKGSISPGVFSSTLMEGLYYRVGDMVAISVKIVGTFTTEPIGDLLISLPLQTNSPLIGQLVNVVGSSDYWYWKALGFQKNAIITKLNSTENMQFADFKGELSFSGTYFIV